MSIALYQTSSPTLPAPPSLRRRLLRMTAVWASLGALVGASVGMVSGGPVGALATMFAGAAEMAALGAIFGLIGGRPGETLVGAVGGMTAGVLLGVAGAQTPVVLVADLGLVAGAIAGATLRPYVRLLSLPLVLLGRLLSGRRRRLLVEGARRLPS